MLSMYNTQSFSFKRQLNEDEIQSIRQSKQHFSDCYLIATLDAMTNSENGKNILKENIQSDDENPDSINYYLYDKKGNKELYKIPANTVVKNYEKLYEKQPNEIVRGMDIAESLHEKKYRMKPFISKLGDKFKTYNFEYNLPSVFMKQLTGKEPIVIGERGFNTDLKKYKNQVLPLLKRMEEEKEYNFVLLSGVKKYDNHRWHAYVIQNVDMENDEITIKEKRNNTPKVISTDEMLSNFKSITGYFNSDLEQNQDI